MKQLIERKYPNLIPIIFSMIVLIGSIALIFWGWSFNHVGNAPLWLNNRTERKIWNNIGDVSTILGMIAFSIWVFRTALAKMKKEGVKNLNLGTTLLKYLRKNHVLLGWVAFGLGLGHSVYFLVYPRGNPMNTYTGLIAMAGMLWVVSMGIIVKYKTVNMKFVRYRHFIAAIVFGIALVVHIL